MIVGIDSGQQGGLFFLGPANPTTGEAFDMPTLQLKRGGSIKGVIDEQALVGLLRSRPLTHAFVEQVGAMPKQGRSSICSFCQGYGIIRGVLAGLQVPVDYVSPVAWKRVMQCPREKDGARARASQLLPQAAHQWRLKKDHGRAEAGLIVLYGLRRLGIGEISSEAWPPVPPVSTRTDGRLIKRPRA